jgi:hypothetical protein
MATPKVMKLLDPRTGLMEHRAPGGRGYYWGSWQCRNGCKSFLMPRSASVLPYGATGLKGTVDERHATPAS